METDRPSANGISAGSAESAATPAQASITLESLKSKGMTIGDEAAALRSLAFISYYRLKAYLEEFLVDPQADLDGEDEQYLPLSLFEDGVALYLFDRDLRLLVLDAVERAEVAYRSLWERQVSKHGQHGYHAKRHLYRHLRGFDKALEDLREDRKTYLAREDLTVGRKKWATRLRNGLPPAWVAAEMMDWGSLMLWVNRLKPSDQREMAAALSMHANEFVQVGFHLSFVRNICAHHSPLWNRTLRLDQPYTKALPDVASIPETVKATMARATRFKLHNTLVLLHHLLSILAADEERWLTQLVTLIDREPLSPACLDSPKDWMPSCMGFPANWRALPPWRCVTS